MLTRTEVHINLEVVGEVQHRTPGCSIGWRGRGQCRRRRGLRLPDPPRELAAAVGPRVVGQGLLRDLGAPAYVACEIAAGIYGLFVMQRRRFSSGGCGGADHFRHGRPHVHCPRYNQHFAT